MITRQKLQSVCVELICWRIIFLRRTENWTIYEKKSKDSWRRIAFTKYLAVLESAQSRFLIALHFLFVYTCAFFPRKLVHAVFMFAALRGKKVTNKLYGKPKKCNWTATSLRFGFGNHLSSILTLRVLYLSKILQNSIFLKNAPSNSRTNAACGPEACLLPVEMASKTVLCKISVSTLSQSVLWANSWILQWVLIDAS